MSHIIVTPDRGDRKVMMDFCQTQVHRFNPGFGIHCMVDYAPKSNGFDLTERVHEGFKSAIETKVDWIILVESDDYYPIDYIENILSQAENSDFIGCEFTYYYNIKEKTWERLYHPNRSSLFCTAFRVSAMLDFKWHLAHKLFLDIDIWKYAKKNGYRTTFIDAGAIGIKGHGFGLAGGKGHVMKLANKDPEMKWLQSKTDEQSFEFYKSLSEK